MNLSLYSMFCTDTLRHRETARKIAQKLASVPKTDTVVIDFSRIEFASRSFLHELLSSLNDWNLEITNQNEEVQRMIEIISKSKGIIVNPQ